MLKHILTCVISLLPVIAHGQQNYFIKNDGEKVLAYPTLFAPTGLGISNERLEWYDKAEKRHEIHQSEVKEMFAGGYYYIQLPITKRYNRLVRVLATSEKYILSSYSMSSADYLFIHDKQSKEIVEGKVRYYNVKTDYKDLQKVIKKYFPVCYELFITMDANGKRQEKEKKIERDGPFDGISNMTCK